MSSPDISYVTSDDWCGIYINGTLWSQGHFARDDWWIQLLEDLADIKVKQIWTDMEDEDRLPSNIKDIAGDLC